MTKTSTYRITSQAISASGTFTSAAGIDATAAVGLALQATIIYTTVPTTPLLLEVLNSGDNSDFDTDAFVAQALPYAASTTKIVTVPIPYAECIRYYKIRLSGCNQAVTVSVEEIAVTP